MLDAQVSESDFQHKIVEYAKLRGWLVHAERPSTSRNGKWATAIQGDAGFPDLVLARKGRVIFAELKRQGQKERPSQRRWLDALVSPATFSGGLTAEAVGLLLQAMHQVAVYVWVPTHWPEIERVLA